MYDAIKQHRLPKPIFSALPTIAVPIPSLHDNPTIFYKAETSVDYPFTEQERRMLDRIIRKYSALTGTEQGE